MPTLHQALGHTLQCRVIQETIYGTDPTGGTVIPVLGAGPADAAQILRPGRDIP